MSSMKIAVGSTNPVKIEAVRLACADHFPNLEVVGVEVKSGVSAQPRSDGETKRGAINRSKQALLAIPDATLGVGLEGGVHKQRNSLVSTNWCVVVDQRGNLFLASGARFSIPEHIAQPINAGGEMGPVLDEMLNAKDTKKGPGLIGILTKSFMTRTQLYMSAAKVAIGLWYGAQH